MKRWQLQDAKASFSEVVRAAQEEGPQEITVRGKSTAVLLSKADFLRLQRRRDTFVEFMRKSPLAGLVLEIERDCSPARPVDL